MVETCYGRFDISRGKISRGKLGLGDHNIVMLFVTQPTT